MEYMLKKVKTEERYMLVYLIIYFILLCQRVSTSKILFEYKNVLSKLF